MTKAQRVGRATGGADFEGGIGHADSRWFPPFKESMPYQVQVLSRLTQNDYMMRIVETGVAPAQAYVLGELWMEEPLSQVELARRLDIGKATIGKTLSRLERAGVIERRRVPTDRRVIMIHLTQAGHKLRKPLGEASEAQATMLVSRLGADRYARLTELLAEATSILRPECAALAERGLKS